MTNGTSAVLPKIEYVIFDMDGLMIDSEKVYTDVTNKILGQYGKEMTWDMKAGLMGKPERQAAEHLLASFPYITLTLESYLSQRNALQDAIWPTVPLLPGVQKLVLHLKAHNIPIAVATGSRRRNFELKTGHLGEVFDCFEGKVVCGDDTRFGMRGKPAPDIFLVAAREMLGRDVGHAKPVVPCRKLNVQNVWSLRTACPVCKLESELECQLSGSQMPIFSMLATLARKRPIRFSNP